MYFAARCSIIYINLAFVMWVSTICSKSECTVSLVLSKIDLHKSNLLIGSLKIKGIKLVEWTTEVLSDTSALGNPQVLKSLSKYRMSWILKH